MSDDLIPSQIIQLISVMGGLFCIYAVNTLLIGGILPMVAIVLSSVYGSNVLRKVGKYSLGTGIPSIVYMLSAVALVGFFAALSVSVYLNSTAFFPLLAIVLSVLLAYLVSLVCKYIFDIQIEILGKSFVSLAVASVLMIISMSVFVTQSFDVNLIYNGVIENALILLLMICSVMIIQNPYNSCMGPNEDQYRTLSLAVSNAFLIMIVLSVITCFTSDFWWIYLLISIICWIIFFRKYVGYTKHQVASIKHGGLWTTGDGE